MFTWSHYTPHFFSKPTFCAVLKIRPCFVYRFSADYCLSEVSIYCKSMAVDRSREAVHDKIRSDSELLVIGLFILSSCSVAWPVAGNSLTDMVAKY